MYLPDSFAVSDLAALDGLVAANPFATLVSIDGDTPFATHLPVLYRRDGDMIEFRGHWARPNPQWRQGGNVLLIVHGPDAYISPGWYPDKETASRVPTWNYSVAHCTGTLDICEDEAALADIVDALSRRHEAAIGSDWRFEPERESHRRQLRGIVGFRMCPTQVEVKRKLNQNHPAANITSTAAALTARGSEHESAIAAMMLSALHATDKTETG